ncbi:MAG: flagellar basal body rod C-terminal domain-containing protein, partial [Lysobacter spongiicola]|nr:flagellar basal body rod C-terminal domain-containing protein [Lysobacter spongiicola]
LDQERWLAVQTPGGETAYTRAGDLKLSPNGLLTTASGLSVLDQQGAPIAIPPHESLHIGGDGTISIVPLGEPEANIGEAGRLQVVAARTDELVRGDDGLMRLPPGAEPLPPAAGKVLTAGALEQSNADPTASLVSMIQLSRQFEMQVRVLQSGDENAQASNSLLSSR